MSQLDSSSVNFGQTQQFLIQWDAFVKNVLEVTIQGYHNLCKLGLARRNLEENQFTGNLEDCIRPFAAEKGLVIDPLSKMLTSEMKAGKKTSKKAKEIDLKLFGLWTNDYHKFHFVWECKLIATPTKKEYQALIYEYITQGIVRFLLEEWKYASYVDDAGMIGYILHGEANDIVYAINQEMLVPPQPRKSLLTESRPTHTSLSSYSFSLSDNLKQASVPGTFIDIYKSSHNRAFCNKSIRLYHLFLTFDFDQKI